VTLRSSPLPCRARRALEGARDRRAKLRFGHAGVLAGPERRGAQLEMPGQTVSIILPAPLDHIGTMWTGRLKGSRLRARQ